MAMVTAAWVRRIMKFLRCFFFLHFFFRFSLLDIGISHFWFRFSKSALMIYNITQFAVRSSHKQFDVDEHEKLWHRLFQGRRYEYYNTMIYFAENEMPLQWKQTANRRISVHKFLFIHYTEAYSNWANGKVENFFLVLVLCCVRAA